MWVHSVLYRGCYVCVCGECVYATLIVYMYVDAQLHSTVVIFVYV